MYDGGAGNGSNVLDVSFSFSWHLAQYVFLDLNWLEMNFPSSKKEEGLLIIRRGSYLSFGIRPTSKSESQLYQLRDLWELTPILWASVSPTVRCTKSCLLLNFGIGVGENICKCSIFDSCSKWLSWDCLAMFPTSGAQPKAVFTPQVTFGDVLDCHYSERPSRLPASSRFEVWNAAIVPTVHKVASALQTTRRQWCQWWGASVYNYYGNPNLVHEMCLYLWISSPLEWSPVMGCFTLYSFEGACHSAPQ